MINLVEIFRWGTSDRTVGDGSLTSPNSTGPYVRRRSGAGVTESTSSTTTTTTATPTIVSVTTSLPSTTTANVTVTSSTSLDDSTGGKRRSNLPPTRDEEAEAQRKHRSAVARRERRSTQSVTADDIKAAEQQIKNQPNNSEMILPQPTSNIIEPTLLNTKIGAPSTGSSLNEHDIETERLQRLIEEKRKTTGINDVRSSLFIFTMDQDSTYAFN